MDYERPTPPATIPTQLTNTLDECDADTLRAVAEYANALAEYRERDQRLDADQDADDRPDDVPSRASITVKEINDNRYEYWQWRDGDQIKSQYKGPEQDE